jgi:hypothetical protein
LLAHRGTQPTALATPAAADANGSGGQRSFNYLFYIDFVGSLADPSAQNALRHLQVSELPAAAPCPCPGFLCSRARSHPLATTDFRQAASTLQEFAPFLRVLGSYPMDMLL